MTGPERQPRPLRIGLFLLGGDNWIGGRHYTHNLVLALDALPAPVRDSFEICLLSTEADNREAAAAIEGHFDEYHEVPPRTATWRTRLSTRARLGLLPDPAVVALIEGAAVDFAYPFNPGLARLPFRSAAWIPDFQHFHLKHLFSLRERVTRTRRFAQQAAFAQRVVLSSHDAARDYRARFWPWANKARVLHFHTSTPAAWFQPDPGEVVAKYQLPERFFIVSNQFWEHKNHALLFRAVARLAERGQRVDLACTGRLFEHRNPGYARSLRRLLVEAGVDDRVRILGLIPRLDQVQLMRASLAVLQPSLFEGWGTVVEDARALGKRVVLSDIPIHREQGAPGSIFFEPTDVEGLARVLGEGAQAWPSGPDLEAEAEARRLQVERVQMFGEAFLALARGEEEARGERPRP